MARPRPVVLKDAVWADDPTRPGLITATKPCPACIKQAEADGSSALNLCNVKRIKAYDEDRRSYP